MNLGRVAVGWLSLVALYTALTQSDKIAALLGTTTTATRALSDPTRPLIRDHAGSTSSAGSTYAPGPTPGGTSTAPAGQLPGSGQTVPNGSLPGLSGLSLLPAGGSSSTIPK